MEQNPNTTDSTEIPAQTPAAGQVVGPGGTTPSTETPQTAPQEPITVPETYTHNPQGAAPVVGKGGRRFGKKSILITVLALLVVLGGGAAAYFGYYVPNKPENILADAVNNTLLEHNFTTKGTLETSSGNVSGKFNYSAAVNEDTHSADIKLEGTISGVTIPLEVIIANGNAYFKVGDISSLQGLLNAALGNQSSDYKKLEDQVIKAVTNQWISIDSTLIKQAHLNCFADFQGNFSQSDIDELMLAYKNHPFITINNHSADQVNGQSAVKFGLTLDDDKLSTLDLSGTQYVKRLNSCLKQANASKFDTKTLKDGDKFPFTVWVDKQSNRIIKYSAKSTAQDKSNGVEGNVTGTISYEKVTVSAPANAKPVLNLLNDIDFSSLQSISR